MSQRFKPHLALITVQILFGIWPIFGKIVLRSMSSTSLVALRLAGAAVLFAVLQRRFTPLLRMPLKDIVLLTACSLLGIVGNQFLFVKGLSLTTVINVEILSTTIPVYALATSILLGYERGSSKTLLGVLLSAAGLLRGLRSADSRDRERPPLIIELRSMSFASRVRSRAGCWSQARTPESWCSRFQH